ncbi:MAG: zf-HC2 domain-containing protein [Gemmatimonadales bacterium]
MSEHISLERTHDLIDGLLPSEAAERARSHMAECAECRERHAVLSELASDLRALPRDATPSPEIWQAIARRIDGTTPASEPESADVLVLPGVRPAPRRVSFSIPQLAAASVVLAVMSASILWMATSRPTPEVAVETERESVTRFASDEASYDTALDELMTIVETARPFLAPETLLALDQSLAEIDAAIEDIGTALENDPSSDLLQSMLVNQQRSKLRVLSQVATLTQSQS